MEFFVLDGAAKEQFAEIRRAFRLALFANRDAPEAAKAVEKIYRDTMDTPVIIVVTTRVSADPVLTEDDYAAAMIATQKMLLGAAAQGVGMYMRTGGLIYDPALRALLRLPEDRRVAAIVYAGYPAVVPRRTRTPRQEKTVWLSVAVEPIAASPHPASLRDQTGIVIDLVCGMEVEIAMAPATSVYRGQTYYFCAPGCKRAFDEDPDAYA